MAAQPGTRRALITGLTGQDGSFLAELLLEQGYHVTGIVRRTSGETLGSSEHLRDQVELVRGDLLAPEGLAAIVADLCPDELYHLAAPSFVPDSWSHPARTLAAIAGATATLLEAIRDHCRLARVFVASSGVMFGATAESPQHEQSPRRPETPYAAAKLAGHELVGQLRSHDGIFCCSGILYNHESERRPESFASRKITRAAAAIKLGLADELVLGDLTAVRDWSFAGDVMRGAWLMLQQDEPGDYILSSGVGHTVADLVEVAFAHVGLAAEEHIRIDPDLIRAPEKAAPVGDPSRARQRLGWTSTMSFERLIQRMVDADLVSLRQRRD